MIATISLSLFLVCDFIILKTAQLKTISVDIFIVKKLDTKKSKYVKFT